MTAEASLAWAQAAARDAFGFDACRARALPSYDDTNVRLEDGQGERRVLKLARAGSARAVLEAEAEALERLAAAGVPAPRAQAARDGSALVELADPAGGGMPRLARLVTWLSGEPLADVRPRDAELRTSLGVLVGRVDRALEGFDPPALRRELSWDLLRVLDARAFLPELRDRPRRARVATLLERFEARVLPRLARLPRAVIHNDANDYNLFVADGRASGILDFGDMLHTARVGEAAILLTYVMLDEDEPLSAARPTLAGYCSEVALEPRELALLPELVRARLALSVLSSAHASRRDPGNDYLRVSQAGAWRLLDQLETLGDFDFDPRP